MLNRLPSTNEQRSGECCEKTNDESSANEFDQFHYVPAQPCLHLHFFRQQGRQTVGRLAYGHYSLELESNRK
jgi:hypothetical protein